MTITQIAARAACFLDGVQVAAQDLRDGQNALLTSAGATGTTGIAGTAGVRYAVGSPLACTWVSGMGFNLGAGMCFVQGTASTTSGLWPLVLDTTTLLTVGAADPTNPRIDSVIAVVSDVGTSSSTALFKILPGTPAGSPVAPALPANALLLANITIAANAVALSAGVFADKRVWTVAAGGILPVATTTSVSIPGPVGSYVHNLATGRIQALDGSGGARVPKVAGFTPVFATVSSAVTIPTSGTNVQVTSVSFTVDGFTEVEITAMWQGYSMATAVVGARVDGFFSLDGSGGLAGTATAWSWEKATTAVNVPSGGGSVRGFCTPSAGTHTMAWYVGQPGGGTQVVTISSGSPVAVLRVGAVAA